MYCKPCVYTLACVHAWGFWTCDRVLFVFGQSGPVFFGILLCQAICFSPTFVAVMKAVYGKQPSGLLSPPTDDILLSFPLSSPCLHLIWSYVSKATLQNGKKSNTKGTAGRETTRRKVIQACGNFYSTISSPPIQKQTIFYPLILCSIFFCH